MPVKPAKGSREISVSGPLVAMGKGSWTRFHLDPKASSRLGGRGKIRVRGTINGTPFESTAIPNGDGTHSILVTKPIRGAARVGPGDRVSLRFETLAGPRLVNLPPELDQALRADTALQPRFHSMTAAQRSAWGDYVASAKQAETRVRRALRSLERIRSGAKTPSD